MKRSTVAWAVAIAGAAAAGCALHRATHPADARYVLPQGARPLLPPSDHLFEVPVDVTHHHIATPDGAVLHAVERGRGRPLVLVHGITLRHDVWAPQFHHLADRYRVISLDLRGHGESTVGSAGYGMARLGDDLATVLEALDLRDALVAGHSMGGMALMQFSGDHPDVLGDRVSGLVFVATQARPILTPAVVRGARHLLAKGQERVDSGLDLPARDLIGERVTRLAFGARPSPQAVRLVADMGRSMEPVSLVGSVTGLLDHDGVAALRDTDTPSMVVVGTRDTLTPVPNARHLARLLPDCDFVVLPRAGHQLMQERPDELAELIDGFAERVDGDAQTLAQAVGDDVPADVDFERPV